MFGIKFFLNGKWVTVAIDDRIPCTQAREGEPWMPLFAGPKAHGRQKEGEKELWPMLFEKAWAKLHLSYEATAGGNTEDAFSYLSGGIIASVPIAPGDANDSAWDQCYQVSCRHPI